MKMMKMKYFKEKDIKMMIDFKIKIRNFGK